MDEEELPPYGHSRCSSITFQDITTQGRLVSCFVGYTFRQVSWFIHHMMDHNSVPPAPNVHAPLDQSIPLPVRCMTNPNPGPRTPQAAKTAQPGNSTTARSYDDDHVTALPRLSLSNIFLIEDDK